jgi:hypothetical protein
MKPFTVNIPYSTYQSLLEHLQIHAHTDAWASSLLKELESAARPIFESGDLNSFTSYRKEENEVFE